MSWNWLRFCFWEKEGCFVSGEHSGEGALMLGANTPAPLPKQFELVGCPRSRSVKRHLQNLKNSEPEWLFASGEMLFCKSCGHYSVWDESICAKITCSPCEKQSIPIDKKKKVSRIRIYLCPFDGFSQYGACEQWIKTEFLSVLYWRCFSSLADVVKYHNDFPQNQYRQSQWLYCDTVVIMGQYITGRFCADSSTTQLISTTEIIQTHSLVSF